MNSSAATWVLVTDCGRARLFATSPHAQELIERSDPAFSSDTPVEPDNHLFASHLAEHLQQALDNNGYGQLILISPPEFLSVLRGKLSSEVCRTVTELIGLDMTKSPVAAIAARVSKLINHG